MSNIEIRPEGIKSVLKGFLTLILIMGIIKPALGSAMDIEATSGMYYLDKKFELMSDIYIPLIQKLQNQQDDWPMVGANPQRTSWTSEEVQGYLHVEWYRPIEAYISQNVQIIASYGKLFVSTARGLYALNASNGETVWRFDTELPLGNSPSIKDEVVYVGGYDRKLHALDVNTGVQLWEFTDAESGFDTNPLVIEGKVILGNRDGYMYAIGAHQSQQQGELIWKYKTGGPIHLSAAYKNGVVYFASDDNYAYALRVSSGELVWKSNKLPGDGYHSYWPVVYKDKVIFSAASGYRYGISPGFGSLEFGEREDIFPEMEEGMLLGPEVPTEEWGGGHPIIDATRLTEYYEDNPDSDPHKHKPWRRTVIVLNMSDGSEYKFDSDGDGFMEYIPIGWWGTSSGNRYPPIVGSDNILYSNNIYRCCSDAKGMVMGWNIATPSLLSVKGGLGALAEPQAISSGGNLIYRDLCCDRVGDYFDIQADGHSRALWSYDLGSMAPEYDEMWMLVPGLPRLQAWYKGDTNSINAAYHNHGDQNPIIPYSGRLYVHRSNAIFAFGSGPSLGKLPLLKIQHGEEIPEVPSLQELKNKLAIEVKKILDSGHLRPGYINSGAFNFEEGADFFDNPGDTIYTLARAYPYLSSELQEQTKNYLLVEFQKYFDNEMYATIGWTEGEPREAMPLPPEVEIDLQNFPPIVRASSRFSWDYPPQNFYAMWLYAILFPGESIHVYELAKARLQVPVPDRVTPDYCRMRPFELNAYIAGYVGFLKLQEFAGMNEQDQDIHQQVMDELNRLLQLKINIFSKDSYWGLDDYSYWKQMDIAGNFIYLVPELGDYMNQNMLSDVQEAVDEYEYIAPYWFVARYEATIGEGVISNLYNYNSLFQAKAYILKEPQYELFKYLDIPAFEKGDLFFIQNIIAVIEAQENTYISSNIIGIAY